MQKMNVLIIFGTMDNGIIGNFWGDYEEKYPDA